MARVQYGAIITELNGSIGGITFQSNAASKIARLKFSRHRKNTAKQGGIITAFQSPFPTWGSLLPAQRAGWDAFAAANTKIDKWGVTKVLSGFNWFMSLNLNLALCGVSFISDAPVYETPLVVPYFFIQVNYNGMWINFSTAFAHASHYLLVFSTSLLRSVASANRKALRLTKIVSPGSTEQIDFADQWEATHGISIPIAGQPTQAYINVAVITIHATKGLNSAYTQDADRYVPDL